MHPRSKGLLSDARVAAANAKEHLGSKSLDQYANNRLIVAAVEREMEIVGEALNELRRIDPETAASVPDIHKAVALRNIITHAYRDIDYVTIWETVTNNVPALIDNLDKLLGYGCQ